MAIQSKSLLLGRNKVQGVLGVIDGQSPKGVEGQDDITWRRDLPRKIGCAKPSDDQNRHGFGGLAHPGLARRLAQEDLLPVGCTCA